MIRIAVTGPESTGKSSLSEELANHYNTIWVPEFARSYIDSLSRKYNLEDILEIANEQIKLEQAAISEANQILICDTELIVIKIWIEHYFEKCPEWIEKHITANPYDLYLLMNTDLQWEDDPQREHPEKRKYFFNKFETELIQRSLPYKTISGQGKERLMNAVSEIDNLIN